jgi:hypothetical protein
MLLRKLIPLLLLLAPLAAFATSCPTGYSNSFSITIPAQTGLSGSLTNYPAPFIGHLELATTANGGYSQSSGTDVIFCTAASGGTLLSYELVAGTYNATTGAGVWWIQVPTVSNTTAQTIYALVGKSSASDESCGPSGLNNCGSTIWSGYLQVHHFGTSGTLTLTDSTGNCTATNHGATATAGPNGFGAAALASASSQYIDTGCISNPTAGVTYKTFVNPSSFVGNQRILSNLTSSSFNGYELLMGYSGTANGTVLCQTGSGGNLNNNSTAQGSIPTGTWALLACVAQSGSSVLPYIAGVQAGSGSNTYGVGASSVDLDIGRWSGGASNYFNGSVAEVEVYNGVQSAALLKADSISWSNPAAFMVFQAITSARYISAAGSDANSGASTGSPWLTLTHASAFNYGAGSSINLRGGDTFSGTLSAIFQGSQASPVLITSYGTGQATISSSAADGIDALSGSTYYTISNLILTGCGWSGTQPSITVCNGGSGVNLINTGSVAANTVTIENNTISGYQQGVTADSSASSSYAGIYNLSIYNNNVSGNLTGGILIKGYNAYGGGPTNTFQNVYIGYNRGVNIPGDPNSGSGGVHGSAKTEAWFINVQNTTGSVIEKNYSSGVAGWGGYTSGLTVGGSSSIQYAASRNFAIIGNEITQQGEVSTAPEDGSAIDIDTNTANYEVAFNLTYNNVGPGIQMGSASFLTNTNGYVHHNISYLDDQTITGMNQGAIRFWGFTSSLYVFNNTVVLPCTTPAGTRSVVSFEQGTSNSPSILNNIFESCASVPIYHQGGPFGPDNGQIGTSVTYGNLYYAPSSFLLSDVEGSTGGLSITTLAQWQGYGYETLNGNLYGVVASPGLSNPSGFSPPSGGFLANGGLNLVSNFNLSSGSAAIGAGVDPELAGVWLSWVDFHRSFARNGVPVDIGANAYLQPAGSSGTASNYGFAF